MKGERSKTLLATIFTALLIFSVIANIPLGCADVNVAGSPGSGWKPDVAVQGGSWPGENEANPSIATYFDSSTGAVTLWSALQDRDAAGKWYLHVWRSNDMGATWQQHQAIMGDSGRSLINPSIAVSPYNGTVFVAVQKTGGGFSNDIAVVVISPGSPFQFTVYDIDADADDDRSPQLASEYGMGAGNWLFVTYERYVNYNDRDLCFAWSATWGQTWSTWTLRGGAGTSEATDVFTQSDIAVPQRLVCVAFRHSTDYDTPGKIELMTWGLGEWNNVTVTPAKNIDASWPTIEGSHQGDWFKPTTLWVAYQNYSGSNTYNDILACWSKDYGETWGSTVEIARTTNWEENPQLSVDGIGTEDLNVAGYFHLVYLTSEDTATRTNGIYYTQIATYEPASYSIPQSPGFEMGWSTPQGQIINNNGNATWTNRIPSITTFKRTVAGQTFWVPGVAWTDGRNNPNLDVYFTTLDTFVSVSVYPSGQTIVAGGSLSYYVTVTLNSGTTATASLDIIGPNTYHIGSAAVWGHSYSPSTVTPTATSLLTFNTANYLGPGNYFFFASAVVGGYRRLATITFTVVAGPTLTLNINPPAAPRGAPLTISGQLTPGLATTINLYYRYPHATGSWKLATTISTNAGGAYSKTATIPTGMTPGIYDLIAVWFNPANGAYTASPIRVLTIT